MTRRSWWLSYSTKGVIILCVIVVLSMGFWSGWSIDRRFGEAGFHALYQGFSCILIVLAMALVRKLFEFRSVRVLFNVLAVLIGAAIVLNDLTILAADKSVSSIEKREGLMMVPLFTIGSLLSSVLVTTVLGLCLKLGTRFKESQTK